VRFTFNTVLKCPCGPSHVLLVLLLSHLSGIPLSELECVPVLLANVHVRICPRSIKLPCSLCTTDVSCMLACRTLTRRLLQCHWILWCVPGWQGDKLEVPILH
jgi:hypothetical protein